MYVQAEPPPAASCTARQAVLSSRATTEAQASKSGSPAWSPAAVDSQLAAAVPSALRLMPAV